VTAVSLEQRALELLGDVIGLLDLDELSRGLVIALRQAVPSDWCALHELPPDLPRTISLVEPPIPFELHELFARYADQNPLVRYYMRTQDGRAMRFSDVITLEELHALELHQQIYALLGVDYQIAFTLPASSGRLLGIALSRTDRDFDDTERDLLNLARPYLIQAYRNAVEHTLAVRAVGGEPATSDLCALGLTLRQAEVLRLIAMGHSDQDAAAALGIGLRTAQKHLERCYRALGVENRSQAARIAWDAAQT
jgi:DNA-binding NarL/FixJ family response regulator